MAWKLTGEFCLSSSDALSNALLDQRTKHLAGGVMESYKRISAALMRALQLLGLRVQQQASSMVANGGDPAAVCFEVPSDYEITLGGRKLIGSAQARRKGGVLQHGSLPLSGDIARITQALRYESDEARAAAAERVRARAATVQDGLGHAPSYAQAAEAFVAAFAEVLNIYNRENVRAASPGINGNTLRVIGLFDTMFPLIPSVGLQWEF